MAIVGSSVVVGKTLVARMPIFVIGGLRFALASVILLTLVVILERPRPRLGPRDVAILILQAFTGIFAFNALLLFGLRLTTAAEAGIVTSTTPAVAAALATLVLRERWTPRRTVTIVLAVLGILVLNLTTPSSGGARGPTALLGDLLVFGAVLGEAIFLVCSRVVSQRQSPLVVATGMSLLGLVMFAPFALQEARSFDFGALVLHEWIAITYYGVAVTVLAFLLWAHGIARVEAGTAAAFTSVLPVSVLGLSYTVLGEPFAWAHLGGGACVIGALAILARRTPRTRGPGVRSGARRG